MPWPHHREPAVQSCRHLIFFVTCLCLGAVLAVFPRSQMPILLVLLAIPALLAAGLALFVVFNGLPRGQRRVAAGAGPQGLGSPWLLAGLALAAALLFSLWPGLDLWVARALHTPSGFVGQGWFGNFLRATGYTLPFLVLAAWVLGWLAAHFGWPTPFAPRGREVLFLSLAMAIGPGLVVNLAMKDHLHRPRPVHLDEFGGGLPFRAFYQFDGGCKKNCSFPSGEASAAFWMLGPASLAPAPWRPQAYAAAWVFALATGLLRMAFGGHFVSDVVFAALIMWALLLGLKWLLYGRPQAAT